MLETESKEPAQPRLREFDVEAIIALGLKDAAAQHVLINNYLGLFELTLKAMLGVPVYPDYQGLAKIKDYVGFAHNYVVESAKFLKIEIEPEIQAELTSLLVKLLPGLSSILTSPTKKPGEPIPHEANLSGWEQMYQNDSFVALQKIVQFDRMAASYPGSEIHGRNKLARIFIAFNPGALNLITQKMNAEQRADFIETILAGKIPYSLITDQEIARVFAQQTWRKAHSENAETAGPEPTKSARTLFLTAIDEAISKGQNPDYAAIEQQIVSALPDPNPEYAHMVDVTADDYDPRSDIPWNMWGESRPMF